MAKEKNQTVEVTEDVIETKEVDTDAVIKQAIKEFKAEQKEVEDKVEQKETDIKQIVKDVLEATKSVETKIVAKSVVIPTVKEIKMYSTHAPLRYFKDEKSAHRVGTWVKELMLSRKFTQVEGTDSRGGYFVPTELSSLLLELQYTYGVARQNTTIIPMNRLSININQLATGISVEAVSEVGSKPEKNKTFTQITLTAQEWAAIVPFSKHLLEDSVIDLAEMFVDNLARAFAEKEDYIFFMADGVADKENGGKTGLVNLVNDGGKVVTSTADAVEDVSKADVDNMMKNLPSFAYTNNTAWYGNSYAAIGILDRIASDSGGTDIIQSAGVKPVTFYRGHPIHFVQSMPGAEVDNNPSMTNKLVLLFGDLKKSSVFGDRKRVEFSTSEHVRFESNEIVLRAEERFDIAHPFAQTGGSAGPVGPIVGLRLA